MSETPDIRQIITNLTPEQKAAASAAATETSWMGPQKYGIAEFGLPPGTDSVSEQPMAPKAELDPTLSPMEKLCALIFPQEEELPVIFDAIARQHEQLAPLLTGDKAAQKANDALAAGARWFFGGAPHEMLPECYTVVQTFGRRTAIGTDPRIPQDLQKIYQENTVLAAAMETIDARRIKNRPQIVQALAEQLHNSPGWKLIKSFETEAFGTQEAPLTTMEKTIMLEAARQRLRLPEHVPPDHPTYSAFKRQATLAEIALTERHRPDRRQQPERTDPKQRLQEYLVAAVIKTYSKYFPNDEQPTAEMVSSFYSSDQHARFRTQMARARLFDRVVQSIQLLSDDINQKPYDCLENEFMVSAIQGGLALEDIDYALEMDCVDNAAMVLGWTKTFLSPLNDAAWLRKAILPAPISSDEYNAEFIKNHSTAPGSNEDYERLNSIETARVLFDGRSKKELRTPHLIMERARSARATQAPEGSEPAVLRVQFDLQHFPAFENTHEPFIPGFVVVGEWTSANGQRVFDFGRDPGGTPYRECNLPLNTAKDSIAADCAAEGYWALANALRRDRKLTMSRLEEHIANVGRYFLADEGERPEQMPADGRPQLQCQSASTLQRDLASNMVPQDSMWVVGGHLLRGGEPITAQGHAQLMYIDGAGQTFMFDPTPRRFSAASNSGSRTQLQSLPQTNALQPASEPTLDRSASLEAHANLAETTPSFDAAERATVIMQQTRNSFETIMGGRYGLTMDQSNKIMARLAQLHPSKDDPVRQAAELIASSSPKFGVPPAQLAPEQLAQRRARLDRLNNHLQRLASLPQNQQAHTNKYSCSPEMAQFLLGFVGELSTAYSLMPPAVLPS